MQFAVELDSRRHDLNTKLLEYQIDKNDNRICDKEDPEAERQTVKHCLDAVRKLKKQ